MPWEDYLAKHLEPGTKLPDNFKGFDFYDRKTKTAINAKTLDTLTAARLKNPRQVYSTLKGYVHKMMDFDGDRLLGVKLTPDMIGARQIMLAIPAATPPKIWEQIQEAIAYGKANGIEIIVNTLE